MVTEEQFKAGKWSEAENNFLRSNYGLITNKEIGKTLNRSSEGIYHHAKRRGIEKVAQTEYAVYQGDELIIIGNAEQCSSRLGIKMKSLMKYATPSYEGRGDQGIRAINLGKWRIV